MSILNKYNRERIFLKKIGAFEYFTIRLPRFILERLIPQKRMPDRKHEIIKNFQERFGLLTLIETGTYLGDTVYALRNRFKKIYTIELDHALYRNAKSRFARYAHITICEGDSGEILPQIISEINEPSLFWLDAHYSEGITARGIIDTPVSKELKTVFSHPIKNHVILIDDARYFNGTAGYPKLDELARYVRGKNQNYVIETEKDIIRIYPNRA